jgi:uncharacterized membrane protein YcjF (UPF0283 family)
MRNKLTQKQAFTVQSYVKDNLITLRGRTIKDVKCEVETAVGFPVSPSRIVSTAQMFDMDFSKAIPNRRKNLEQFTEIQKQLHTLALAVKEIMSDLDMKERVEVNEIAERRCGGR